MIKGPIAALVAGIVILLLVWIFLPTVKDSRQRETSDAAQIQAKIVIGMDSWIGNFSLCAQYMKQTMRQAHILLECRDEPDYPKRVQQLREGDVQAVSMTVDSYVLNGARENFPGVVVMVIDESSGADGAVAHPKTGITSLDELKGRTDVRIGFTPRSPSHHLAKTLSVHFNVPELMPGPGPLRVEAAGSEDVLQKYRNGEVDIAFLWEPDLTRAITKDGAIKLITTEKTERLIVDVLLFNREYADKYPERVTAALEAYFKTLKYYRDNHDALVEDIMRERRETNLEKDAVLAMLKGVSWVNMTDNCTKWFGIGSGGQRAEDAIIETIQSTVDVLVKMGDFQSSPLPDGNPYRLTQTKFLEALCTKGDTGFSIATASADAPTDGLRASFDPLTDDAWKNLRSVGTLETLHIVFQSGKSSLDISGKEQLDKAASTLRHYTQLRIKIKGHTNQKGDPAKNVVLSQERAEAAARYLQVTYGLDPDRVRAIGLGSAEPLPRKPDESDRAYNYRLSRIELGLVGAVY